MDPPELLASFLDDCWEPEDAVAILRREAASLQHGATDGVVACLRVPGGDLTRAEICNVDAVVPDDELPGETGYLWVLWNGQGPTREFLLELYREFRAAE